MMLSVIRSQGFLFSELVKRDFKKKYKRTYLGMLWSVLSPLLTLFVMRLVFTRFFGRDMPHYTTYLFCGNIVFSYFNESSGGAMTSLLSNSGIFMKVKVPKALFVFSRSVSSLINFSLTFLVFLIFCAVDGVPFTPYFLFISVPILLLILFNLGVGLILSALFVFFRDVQYLWSVFTMLLMYMSAIFYTTDGYSVAVQRLFHLNPIYVYIKLFRTPVLNAALPSARVILLGVFYSLAALALGAFIYKRCDDKFLYYV